jgi:hypothetical protein
VVLSLVNVSLALEPNAVMAAMHTQQFTHHLQELTRPAHRLGLVPVTMTRTTASEEKAASTAPLAPNQQAIGETRPSC